MHAATSKQDQKKYAVKMLDKASTKVADMAQELGIMAQVRHPHIVNFKEVFECPETYNVVLEYIDGGELFDRIIELHHYTEKEASRLFKQILSAVDHLHSKHICHRDLKPENLLLSSKSDDAVVKVADFGFAAVCHGEEDLTALVGTPPYMACELVFLRHQDEGGYGIAVDMWSLGVILYILLSGIHPFQLEDEEEMLVNIENAQWGWVGDAWRTMSKEAKDIVSKLLEPDPRKRLTAKQALEHPWLATAEENPLETEDLRRFQARRKFKGAVRAIAGINRMKLAMKTNLLRAIRETASDKIYTLEQLQTTPLPEDVSEKSRERHLSEEDFQKVFGMDRAAFYRQPAWKQSIIKREHKLMD